MGSAFRRTVHDNRIDLTGPARYDFACRMKRVIVLALVASGLVPVEVSTQKSRGSVKKAPTTQAPAAKAAAPKGVERPVPFKIGETLTYDVSWSSYVTAGTAVMTVMEKKPSFNSLAYYIVAEGRPTPLVGKLYSLYYKLDTLLDSYTLLPQRGSVYSEEGSRHRFKVTQFDHKAHTAFFEYKAGTTATDTFAVPPYVQDALSAVYVLRAVPLKAGDRITMPVSDDGSNYKVQVDAGPSERVKTPFGETGASRLKLSVFDAAGKAQGRNVALWFSDDVRRLPVKMQAELPVGTFNLNLREAR